MIEYIKRWNLSYARTSNNTYLKFIYLIDLNLSHIKRERLIICSLCQQTKITRQLRFLITRHNVMRSKIAIWVVSKEVLKSCTYLIPHWRIINHHEIRIISISFNGGVLNAAIVCWKICNRLILWAPRLIYCLVDINVGRTDCYTRIRFYIDCEQPWVAIVIVRWRFWLWYCLVIVRLCKSLITS